MDKSPDAFRTISEVADLLETPAHVLRFWESRFPQIRPVKRAGGRRYYRPADVALLSGIKHLLHDEGLTIRGVQKILREQGVRHVSGVSDEAASDDDDAALEAALAASGGLPDDIAPLPAAEAETAQIIALQAALGQHRPADEAVEDSVRADLSGLESVRSGDPEQDQIEELQDDTTPMQPLPQVLGEAAPASKKPESAPEDDLFSRFASEPLPKVLAPIPPPTSNEDPQIMRNFEGLGEFSSPGTSPPDLPTEAPMQIWAEEEQHPTEGTHPLKITRIAAPKPGVAPLAGVEAAPRTTLRLAVRLRATHAHDLSPSDRATLSILRAKARSLRDRLGSQPRPGL